MIVILTLIAGHTYAVKPQIQNQFSILRSSSESSRPDRLDSRKLGVDSSLYLAILLIGEDEATELLTSEGCDSLLDLVGGLLGGLLSTIDGTLALLIETLISLGVDPIDLGFELIEGTLNLSIITSVTSLRYCMFDRSLDIISALEDLPASGTDTALFGPNFFSFLTDDEKDSFTGLDSLASDPNGTEYISTFDNATRRQLADPPSEFSWVGTAVDTSIQNQGKCSSCWAFAAIETISALAYVQNEKVTYSLSAQQLLSCETESSVNNGCKGGSYEYVWGGPNPYTSETSLASKSTYPYVDGSTGTTSVCDETLENKGVTFATTNVRLADKTTGSGRYATTSLLKEVLLEHPVAVAIYATNCLFLYKSGVLKASQCTEAMDGSACPLNHAVLLAGYGGLDTDSPYFLLKNAWGIDWGDDGFVRVEMIADERLEDSSCIGMLGMSTMPAFPSFATFTRPTLSPTKSPTTTKTPTLASSPVSSPSTAPTFGTKSPSAESLPVINLPISTSPSPTLLPSISSNTHSPLVSPSTDDETSYIPSATSTGVPSGDSDASPSVAPTKLKGTSFPTTSLISPSSDYPSRQPTRIPTPQADSSEARPVGTSQPSTNVPSSNQSSSPTLKPSSNAIIAPPSTPSSASRNPTQINMLSMIIIYIFSLRAGKFDHQH